MKDRINAGALWALAGSIALLSILSSVVSIAHAQVTSARVTSYDWRCEAEDGTRISDHQREGSAITACTNLSLVDGKTRYVRGGRYRITAKAPTPPAPPPTPPPPAPAGKVTLAWTAPTTNTNGSALTNLAGYRIRYGTSATSLSQSTQVANAGATGHVVQGLALGTWYFSVAAYNTAGTESVESPPVSATAR